MSENKRKRTKANESEWSVHKHRANRSQELRVTICKDIFYTKNSKENLKCFEKKNTKLENENDNENESEIRLKQLLTIKRRFSKK